MTLTWFDGDWEPAWTATRARRPHDHPAYLELQRGADDHPAAVVFTAGDARILYPFYWRSLAALPFAAGEDAIQLTSPYGYGGPLYEGPAEDRVRVSLAFEDAFHAELLRRGAVAEFVREDLFAERLALRNDGEHLEQQKNVTVRLDRTAEEIWTRYKHKVRKNVNAARRAGLRVVFNPSGERLDDFLRVYHDTMIRTSAARSFLIEAERFRHLGDTLGRAGGLLYVHVLDGDEVVSTGLLRSPDCLYSFLGGTLPASFDKRPNDLLKHEVIVWGLEHGVRTYVLGGGVTPGDGIFLYKEAFDPEGVVPFFVRRVCHDRTRYDRLVAARAAYERAEGREWTPRPDFFPAYLS